MQGVQSTCFTLTLHTKTTSTSHDIVMCDAPISVLISCTLTTPWIGSVLLLHRSVVLRGISSHDSILRLVVATLILTCEGREWRTRTSAVVICHNNSRESVED